MEVAIVGAGAAGAGAAHSLDCEVTVFEEGAVGGRAATRRRDDCVCDHGANYLKDDDPRVSALVTRELPTDGLVDVSEPVRTFDADGHVAEGDHRDDHKWTYRDGLAELSRRLLDAAGARVERETRVTELAFEAGRWRLRADDRDLGAFDAVVLTPPAPRTAELLRESEWHDRRRVDLAEAAAAVPYRTVFSALCHYDRPIDRPWYALVNADDGHDVGWVSREECKPGHVPDGESVLVAQMAPDWSAERVEGGDGASDAADAVADLLDLDAAPD